MAITSGKQKLPSRAIALTNCFRRSRGSLEFAAYSHILMQSLRTLVPRAYILPTSPFDPQTVPTVPCCRSNELYVAIVFMSHIRTGITFEQRPSLSDFLIITPICDECTHQLDSHSRHYWHEAYRLHRRQLPHNCSASVSSKDSQQRSAFPQFAQSSMTPASYCTLTPDQLQANKETS